MRPATIKFVFNAEIDQDDAQGRTVSYSSDVFVGEDTVLVEISEAAGLFNECGRETVGISLVVDELGVHKIVKLGGISTPPHDSQNYLTFHWNSGDRQF